ncbi:hypothetical protein [Streptomyces sp. NPDC046759]|uniref:hypothetical protein n=1 Tax=Streptomyces sp. NPDC046759 TaxID=3155019 RepID=UPI0033ECC31C
MRAHVFAVSVFLVTALGAAVSGPAAIDWPAGQPSASAAVSSLPVSGAPGVGTDDIDWP